MSNARGNSRGTGGRPRGRGRAISTVQQSGQALRRPPSNLPDYGDPQPSTSAAAAQANPWNRGQGRPQSSAAPSVQPGLSMGPAPQRLPVPVMSGRAISLRGDTRIGDGAVCAEHSRGANRGKRFIYDMVKSRPDNCISKSGTAGRCIVLQTNYFKIMKAPKWSIHQYRVDFSPEVDLLKLRRAYLAQHKHLFSGYIFDGTVMFSTEYLASNPLDLITKNREDELIAIKIKHVGIVDASDYQQLQLLNLIMRRSMEGLKLQLVGRNYFDPFAKIPVEAFRLDIWPGYHTSIRQHELDLLLNAEVAHKIMRNESIYNILTQCIRDYSDFQTAFRQQVLGTVVLTDYNNSTYRIDEVDFGATPKDEFTTKEGKISYIDYYKKRYNITIRDSKQPLLLSRPTDKKVIGGQNIDIMLIPEICRATGMTDAMRSEFRLMKAVSDYTRLNPEVRIQRLRAFNERIQKCAESVAVLKSWNLQLDTNLVQVNARMLPSEKIAFGRNKIYTCDDYADWTKQFRNTSLFIQPAIKKWIVIFPIRFRNDVEKFVSLCKKVAEGMRMDFAEPKYKDIQNDHINSYLKMIDVAANEDPQLIMIVLINKNEEKYSVIKKRLCIDRPVVSQVVTLRTIAPSGNKASGLMSVTTKIVIQMNAKIKGVPWMLHNFPVPNFMVVGFDVCHSPKDKNKSYGALVATMDINKTGRYFSAVMEHVRNQELSQEIGIHMVTALKAFREEHGDLPARILFFRDGVGDGQLNQVYTTEVKHLKKALDEVYISSGKPEGCKFAFIVVSKRINTRFFMENRNPPPGTVVDNVVTLPERYDFFLVSQSVSHGTVSPTSYNIIHDSMGFGVDRLQMIAYKMTHLYYNWSGTCRVPAVCQYAHKLSFLVANSLHRAPSQALSDRLYFL